MKPKKEYSSTKRIIIIILILAGALLIVFGIKALNQRSTKAKAPSSEDVLSSENGDNYEIDDEMKRHAAAMEEKRAAQESLTDHQTIKGYIFDGIEILQNAGFTDETIETLKSNIKTKMGDKNIKITFTMAQREKSELGTYSNIVEFDTVEDSGFELPFSYISGSDGADGGDVFVNNNKN